MPLKSNYIPNKPLNGREVIDLAKSELGRMLAADCFFNATHLWKNLAMKVTVEFHGRPGSINEKYTREVVVGDCEAPLPPDPQQDRRSGLMEKALSGFASDAEKQEILDTPEVPDAVFSLERSTTVENPNLTRVHHEMPIVVHQRVPPATADDPFPKVDRREITYTEADGYPPPPPPVDVDKTEEFATRIGHKRAVRERLKGA